MPRKPKEITIDVNERRGENYAEHFQCRQFALNYPRRGEIEKLVEGLPRPGLDVYGNACIEGVDFVGHSVFSHATQPYWELGRLKGIDAWMLFYWYWSDAGWEEFQALWRNLPEVVHIPLCTNRGVVHIRTQESFYYPTGK